MSSVERDSLPSRVRRMQPPDRHVLRVSSTLHGIAADVVHAEVFQYGSIATFHQDTGLELAWETNNPGAYPTYVHIGIPPAIGSDGILYGLYEDPTLADAPITLPGEKADWTTVVVLPKDVTGLYILVSVETKQQKNFTSHAVDITDK